ncbi:MAG TPA: MotA/TolQ/ExbB proton channel family protein [Methylomirabilota bacterium]|nr:MotA/TolQ/ExbB proton channel family protein [Methylomirabilota bacterium]
MNVFFFIAAAAAKTSSDVELTYVWDKSTLEGKIIIIFLLVFSIFSWSVMVAKAVQMRRAKKLNRLFENEFRAQKHTLDVYDRRVNVEDCPQFVVYQEACKEVDTRLKTPEGGRKSALSIKAIEHIKRTLESAVASQSIKLESGLILLALAVSGAPFLGLLGTVWGVMSAFSLVAMKGSADLATMAPGVAAALITTVAGLLVAIPSMFGYNYLVHTLRVLTVELDNFAQALVSQLETEYLKDE